MKSQKKAYVLALTAVLLWSTVATSFKIALQEVNPLELLAIASWVSFTVFLLLLIIKRQWRLFAKQTRKDFGRSALLGFLNPCLYYLILFKAYSLLPAQEAQSLNYTWPIVLVLMSAIFLGQKIGARHVLAMSVSFAGVVLISLRGDLMALHLTNSAGVLLALGSSVFWALYWIFNMKDNRDIILRLCTNFLFGTLYITAILLLYHTVRVPSITGILSSVYVGLFEMGITFIVWLSALQASATTARISNLVFLSPFLSLILIHFFLGEKIFISTIAGLILIITGIIIQQMARRPARNSGFTNKDTLTA
jgi:drug/metabolite transporter (DMT)-like permease